MEIKPLNLAEIAMIAEQWINTERCKDFYFLLEDIERIIKLSCKTSWDETNRITIDEIPF